MRVPVPLLVALADDARMAADDFVERLDALLEAGCPAVWLRARGLPAGAFYERALEARSRTRARGAELWVGDRADVARLAAADRLQLPERGLPAAAARRAAGEGIRIGRSVHGVEAALAAAGEGVDHLVVGTIWETASHPSQEPAGPERLTAVRDALSGRPDPPPLLAIGGVTPERAARARTAGAAGAVAGRALWDAPAPGAAAAAFLAALGAGAR